jgi:hypothetical protein
MSKLRLRQHIHSTKLNESAGPDTLNLGEFVTIKAMHGTHSFWIDDPRITSMEGMPSFVPNTFNMRVYTIPIENFIGMPEKFSSDGVTVNIEHCDKVSSLQGMTSNIHELQITNCGKLTKLDGTYPNLRSISIHHNDSSINVSSLVSPKLTHFSIDSRSMKFSDSVLPRVNELSGGLGLQMSFGEIKLVDHLKTAGISKVGILYLNALGASDLVDFEGINTHLKFNAAAGGKAKVILAGTHSNYTGLSRLLMCDGLSTIGVTQLQLPQEIASFITSIELPASRKDILTFTKLCSEHKVAHLV